MNFYRIQIRRMGYSEHVYHTYGVVAESLDLSIENVKRAVSGDFGSEFKYELTKAEEVASNVLLPNNVD